MTDLHVWLDPLFALACGVAGVVILMRKTHRTRVDITRTNMNVMAATGAVSNSYNRVDRKDRAWMGAWNGDISR